MSYYKGKRVLVTGGSEGIGLAVAGELLAAGATVVVASRSQAKLDEARAKFPALETHTLDLCDREAVGRAIDSWEAFEIVINCAGFARPGWLVDQDLAETRAMMETNFFGAANLTQALLPSWIKRRSGHIVHTSSLAGFLGVFGYTGYCASKFAVMGFCEALKRELRPYNIAVSVLCPPNTRTPGLEEENKTKPPEVLAAEETATVLDPDYVAKYLLKKLPRRPHVIIPSLDGRASHILARVLPVVLDEFFLKRPAT